MNLRLEYQDGTLVVHGADEELLSEGFKWDHRITAFRGPASLYSELVLHLIALKIPYDDHARDWVELTDLKHRAIRQPRPYQKEAVAAWLETRRGIVVLPTGSGKSFVAELLIAAVKRPTLLIAPTLDLVAQWHDRLQLSFGEEIGLFGGGVHECRRLTVSTYDSAAIHMARYGNRFAFLIYDEVHHLPAEINLQASSCSMAPYRLGLTATLEREDGREELLESTFGSVVYRREITELSGDYLADYEVIRLWVDLLPEEQDIYRESREEYIAFLRAKRISMRGPNGWRRFLRETSRSKVGRSAFAAYQRSKKVVQSSEAKLDALDDILKTESGRRIIIFTADNFTAYRISSRFLLPCITHQTDLKERISILEDFNSGDLPALVTSRVLNEGVDLPAAEIGVVLSGSGTVREHVQRLGRILRPKAGKKALMYEVVAAGTVEESTSARRRKHDAYR